MMESQRPAAPDSAAAGETAQSAEKELKPNYSFRISTDNMLAYLKIQPAYSGQKVKYEDVASYLNQRGIVFGVQEDAVRAFCENGVFYSEILCAKGLHPVHGTDGSLEYHFDTDRELKPREREDGTVDFRDLGLVKNIKKGEPLCTIIPPQPGKDGTDIFGAVVPFQKGMTPVLPFGSNTMASQDGLTLLAAVDGSIECLKTSINVNEMFIVHGDVDNSSGNLNVNGSVVIQGDVREGFFVKAGKDISVRGMVEGASLEAGGSIALSNGMNGMGHGTLKAAGNITGKYFENAILTSEHDIYSDTLMNCSATAGGSIILKGRKASLIGGNYQAGLKIAVKNIGTPSSTLTKVSIQSQTLSSVLSAQDGSESISALKEELVRAEKELADFMEKYDALSRQIAEITQSAPERGRLMFKASVIKKNQLTETTEQLKQKVNETESKVAELIDFHILGFGIVFPGTKISIGPFSMNIQSEYSNTKFHANQDGIVAGPVLPSDSL